MIKACKWCGKKQEMSGKREFCPGERCKNAWKYAKRTGRLEKGKRVNEKQNLNGDSLPNINRPQWLNEIAGEYWDKVSPTCIKRGHLNILSEDSFAELCDIYSRLVEVNKAIDETNRSLLQIVDTWDNKAGTETQQFKESALSDLKRKYSKLFLDYQKQFYLTPQSNRGNFGLENEEKPQENKKDSIFD